MTLFGRGGRRSSRTRPKPAQAWPRRSCKAAASEPSRQLLFDAVEWSMPVQALASSLLGPEGSRRLGERWSMSFQWAAANLLGITIQQRNRELKREGRNISRPMSPDHYYPTLMTGSMTYPLAWQRSLASLRLRLNATNQQEVPPE